jgi:excisionase family DNA binding protein
MTDLYYTPAEVAEILKVSESAVYKWISEKKLRAAKFGKSRRISRKALDEFIQKGEEFDKPQEDSTKSS